MHNHYIINEVVQFHPATSTLCDLHNPEVVVTLNSPAGRCLLLLISRAGTIVTQQDFMDIVWKQSGMNVTSNAFYQNISVLRKGLKDIGLGRDIIVTIPRIGLTLATGTRIRKLTGETLEETDHENITCRDRVSVMSEEPGEGSRELIVASPLQPAGSDTVCMDAGIHTARRKLIVKCIYRYFFPSFIIIGLIIFIISGFNKKPNYFSDYVSVMSIKGCHILLSQSLSNSLPKDQTLGYGERFINDCQSYPWIYVTVVPYLPRTSVIRCNNIFEKSTNCISEYFIE